MAAVAYWPSPANAVEITLERPGERESVRDLAGMIDEADEKKIRTARDKRLTDKATPIIVVTIESMHGRADGGVQ